LISKDRPRTPIIAFTPSPRIYQRLALWWGVLPRQIEMHGTTEDLINVVDQHLQDENLIAKNAHIVIMGGLPIASRARTNFVRLHRVGDMFS
jgi:pyruvate kinase